MIKTQELGKATRIYSDENKLIRNKKLNQVHSEYVVTKYDLKDFEEVS